MRLSKQEWQDARATWEADQRVGFDWLAADLGISRQSVSKMAKRKGWAKLSGMLSAQENNPAKSREKNPAAPESSKENPTIKSAKALAETEASGKPAAPEADPMKPKMGRTTGAENMIKASFRERAALFADEALSVTLEIMNNTEVMPSVRLKAAEMVLDRGMGKPTAAPEAQDEIGDAPATTTLDDFYAAKMAESARQAEEVKKRLSDPDLAEK
jgi:hypothetical protein